MSRAVNVCFMLHKYQLHEHFLGQKNSLGIIDIYMHCLTAATHLNVHFDDCFPNECRTKKSPEGNQKMSTCYSCQVKQGIWNLGRKQQR